MSGQSTLASLIQRLEAATTRLEEISTTSVNAPPKRSSSSTAPPAGKGIACIEAFSLLMSGPLKEFLDLSVSIGDQVQEQSLLLKTLFEAQLEFLNQAVRTKKKESAELLELIRPTQESMTKIIEMRDKNRSSKLANHLSVVSEGVSAFGWITIEPAPVSFIESMRDSAQFYANRVRTEYKENDRKHVEWVNSFMELLNNLAGYVREFHTTGVCWNSSPGAAPPPVPSRSEKKDVDPRSAILSAINKGDTVLKKPEQSSKPAEKTTKAVKEAPPPKQPSTMLQGNKWIVEYHDQAEVKLEEVKKEHSVYIFECNKSTIQITSKCNSVCIDKCKGTGVVVDTVMANVEIVNSKSVQLQVVKSAPTITVDNTDGATLFLSNSALDMNLLTSKSNTVNVQFEKPGSDGDFIEKTVSEQFHTKIENGTLVTTAVPRS